MASRLDIYNWPLICISWGRKIWTSSWILTTSLQLAFAETRDRWSPVKAFTIQNGSNNRNRINSLSLSLVNTLR